MSQPKEYGPHEIDPLFVPMTSVEQAVRIFHEVERKPADWLIGIEYELFGQVNQKATPIPYEGDISITSLYHALAKNSAHSDDPMLPVYEGPNIVALNCKRAVIALEPGGQIEIAAKPHGELGTVVTIFTDVVREIKHTANALGIDLFALGLHPNASRDDMAYVKKARYQIMRAYMEDLNDLGLDMMTRSCAIQINLDYASEQDMVQKIRLGAILAPIYSLLCSSVAFLDGRLVNHAIERGHVWRKTDPERTGIPSIIFSRDFGYESWINFVLDVPMYFIRRGSTYHDARHASFREFMEHGLWNHTATLRDFVDHMTTVFTDVRLKPILELRSADSLPVPYVNALTALTWALFYHQPALERVMNIFDGITHAELITLQNDIIDRGVLATFRNQPVFDVAKNILSAAKPVLAHHAQSTRNPTILELLNPITSLIEQNTTCAQWIKDHFKTLHSQNLSQLIHHFDPLNSPV